MYIDRIANVSKAGSQSWRFDLIGTAPFTVYKDGAVFVEDLNESELVIEGDSQYEPPAIEVLDSTDTNDPEQITYPPFLSIQWRGNTATSYYRIDRYINSVWTRQTTIRENDSGYYRYDSSVLDDQSVSQFRVRPVDADGNTGHALSITALMVRNPDPPEALATYNSVTGNIEVRARA